MKKIFLITIIIGLHLSVSYGQVPESDSLALVALYNSTNGAGWTNNTNWLQPGQSVSTWYGITVYNDTVEQIRLINNNLTGTLPDALGNFSNLKYLDLQRNQISGTIPTAIGNLARLTYLSLGSNQLTGTITVSIGNLVDLEYLYLYDNELEGSIPVEVSNLVNLKFLNLSVNKLDNPIPAEIGNLVNLERLQLDYNQLTGSIPEEICDLTNLEQLLLSYNQFTDSIPVDIGNLTKLTNLVLAHNNLIGSIPSGIGNLTNLQGLVLYSNQFTGHIPSEIGNLTKLNYLFLHTNHLEGNIPEEIGNLGELKNLCLRNNELSGNIPDEIGNLDSLQQLLLQYNELTGSIPEEICSLNELETIDISSNGLKGRIPEGIRDLPNLSSLSIGTNYFNFNDLESLTGLTIGNFIYDPQGSIVLNTTQINNITGNDLEIDITNLTLLECSATNNQYQWWKDGSSITSYSDSPVLNLADLDISDEGQYYCTMINSDFPLLTITTDIFALIIDGPTDILLTPDSVNENVPSGTIVGLLSAEDPDQTTGHNFEFIEGDGINDADNSLFSMSNDTLFINTSPDYETQQEYSIYVRATDNDSKTLNKALIVYVNDVQESEPNAFAVRETNMNTISVYPNPTSDFVIMEYQLTKKATITLQLFDLHGRLMQTFLSNEIRSAGFNEEILAIDPSFPEGTYILVVSNNSGSQSIQINKQN